MKLTKIVLAMLGVGIAALSAGCSQNSSPAVVVPPTPSANSNFSPADPAKIKEQANKNATQLAADLQKESNEKPSAGLDSTAAPGATAPKAGDQVAVIDTNLGRIVLKFFPDKAPGHVANFIKLAKKGFYDGTKFHRVIPTFMIQGGDPYSKTGEGPVGTGGPGYTIKAEFNDVHHAPGILSMARSSDPDSAGSQFFIVVKESGFLDHQYTAFGQVLKGMDVVNKIANLPRDENDKPTPDEAVMKSVKITTWPLK